MKFNGTINRTVGGRLLLPLPLRMAALGTATFCIAVLGTTALGMASVWAQEDDEAGPVIADIQSAVSRAVNTHPSIAAQAARVGQQRENINQARSGYLPQLSGGLRAGEGWRDDSFSKYVSLSVDQMLYDFGRTASEVDVARSGAETEEAYLARSVEDVIWDTMQAYVELLRNQRLIVLAGEQQQGIERIESLAGQRRNLGAGTGSDEVQARARAEASEALVMTYRARFNRWRVSLASQTQAQPAPELSDDFSTLLAGSCEQSSLSEGSLPTKVLIAEAQRSEAQAMLTRERAQRFPRVSLEAGARQPVAGDWDRFQEQDYSVALNVSFDLYRGGELRSRQRSAAQALRAAEYAADTARLESQQRIYEAAAQVEMMESRLRLLAAQEISQQETRDLYQQQYLSLGNRTLIDLLNAEQELHATRIEIQNVQHDLYLLGADCLYRAGGLDELFGLGTAFEDDRSD